MNKAANIMIACGSVLLLLALAFVYRHRNASANGNQTPLAQGVSSDNPAGTPNAPQGSNALSSNEMSAAVSTNLSGPLADWSEKLDSILAADVSEKDKVRQLLDMFPRLPEAGQVEVANHLSNLLPNEDYSRLAAFATNAALPPDALDILLRDAFNRPNSLKVPVLIEVASNSHHPKAAEAKEALVFLLGQDEGDDWAKWREKAGEWLKANPD